MQVIIVSHDCKIINIHTNLSLKINKILIIIDKILIKIKKIKNTWFFWFFCSDLNHDLNQWFKSNDLNQTTLRRDLPDMDIYFHVHGVEWVLPVIKDSEKWLNHLQILLFVIYFDPKRNVSSSIGLHVYSKSCRIG